MNDDRDLSRLLDSWFAEGPVRVADRVIDGTASRIARQRQHPAWRLQPWRFPTMSTPIKTSRRSTDRSLAPYLAAAAVLIALVAGALAVGSGMVKLPAIVPVEPSPAPSIVALPSATAAPSAMALASPSPAASTAGGPWITGQALMDVLTAEYGYQWSPLVDNSTGVVQSFQSGQVRVDAPVDGPATVIVSGAVDATSEVEQHAGRVTQALAPDVAPWTQDAIAQGLDAYMLGLHEGDPLVTEYPTSQNRLSTTLTARGGQVGVTFVDEKLIGDWASVEFTPDPPPTRMLEPGGNGIVLYTVHTSVDPLRGVDPAGDRIWAVNPDGTGAGLFIPSTRTPYGVGSVLGWSADGSRLFYGGGAGVFAVDSDGSQAFRVGARRDNPLCPVVVPDDDCQANDDISISPDGTRLAYSLQEGNESAIHTIAVLDVASGLVTRLESTRAPGVDMPTWSPDGTRLVFSCPGIAPGRSGICRVNVDGTGLRQILPAIAGDVSDPQWSPDGSSILFGVDGGGRAEIFTIGSDGAGLRSLTSDGLPNDPHWTRDGRIVFITGRGDDLRIMDAEGGSPATIDRTVAAQTAAGCLVCPYPDDLGGFDGHGLWQPMPEGQP